ncbi:MAG: ComEC/Rec2 family competence protein [Lachnospiraceae bacterium]|nr:ComEC/Rec2 family competence protein [Lachnospiraceae bacterium]
MKRPLFFLAVFLTLGVLLLNRFEGAVSIPGWSLPPFRAHLDKAGTDYAEGQFTGRVTDARSNGSGYVLTVNGGPHYGKVLVYLTSDEDETLELIGSEATFDGAFFLFQEATNFGEFSVRDYYDALGFTLGFRAETFSIDEKGKNALRRRIFILRERTRDNLVRVVTEKDAGYFLSILLSDRTLSDADETDAYRRSGLSYLLSSSGLSVALFGSALYRYFSKKTRKKTVLLLTLSGALLTYGALIGFPSGFFRAFVLFLASVFALRLKRKFDVLSASSLVLILFLVTEPRMLFLPAFRVYGAILFASGILIPSIESFFRFRDRLISPLIRAMGIAVSILPVQIFDSFSGSILSPVLSVILYGVRAALFLLLVTAALMQHLFGAVNVFSASLYDASSVIHTALRWIAATADRMQTVFVNGRPETWKIMVYFLIPASAAVILRILFVRRKGVPEEKEFVPGRRHFSYCLAALTALYFFGAAFLRIDPVPGDTLEMTMMDVSQGDGFLFLTCDHAVLVDSGSSDRNDVQEVVRNTLFYYGRMKIDLVMLTHEDKDHTSGVIGLLENGSVPIGTILLPDILDAEAVFSEVIRSAGDRNVPVRFVKAGDRFTAGKMSFTILWPEKGSPLKGNDASMVSEVRFGSRRILMTGDVSSETEKELSALRNADVLKVAHHGSKYSSDPAFLMKVLPDISLISYGKRNVYGHPAPETIQRILKSNPSAKIIGTGDSGASALFIRDDSIRLSFAKPVTIP